MQKTDSCSVCAAAMYATRDAAAVRVCLRCRQNGHSQNKGLVPCSECGTVVMSAHESPVCHPCRRARPGYKSMAKDIPGTCVQCGAEFMGFRQSQRFCSKQCSNSGAYPPRKGRMCAQCGGRYDAGNSEQRCCSQACRREFDAARRPPKPLASRVYFPECRGCSRVFAAQHAAKRWCAHRCWLNNQSDNVMSFYELACQKGWGGVGWRKHLVGYLVERDGNKCGICRRQVDVTLKSGTRGSDRGPSIDHIVPRSHVDGSDDLANLRLTHWGCNRARKARGGNEQLALVG